MPDSGDPLTAMDDVVRGYEITSEGIMDLGTTTIAPGIGFAPVGVYLLD